MSNDNFSQKEILIQLMAKMEILTTSVNSQQVLLTSIAQASENRDAKLTELKTELQTVKEDVEQIKTWQTKAMTIWALLVFVVGLVANKLISTLF
jgi:hypothetical protein